MYYSAIAGGGGGGINNNFHHPSWILSSSSSYPDYAAVQQYCYDLSTTTRSHSLSFHNQDSHSYYPNDELISLSEITGMNFRNYTNNNYERDDEPSETEVKEMKPKLNHHHHHHHHNRKHKRVLHNGMSLFQDLKLKRRKVDSRCSSDGESIGTSDSTASLSPEAQSQAEGSPKDKDRCITPEDLGPSHNSSAEAAYVFMKSNGVIKSNGHGHGAVNGNFIIHVKSEPKDMRMMNDKDDAEINGLSLIVSKVAAKRDHSSRENSIEKQSINGRKSPISETRNSMSSSNPSSDCESTTSRGSSSKREKKRDRSDDDMMMRNSPPPLVSRPRSTISPPGQTNSNNSVSSPTSGIASSPQSSLSSIPSPSSLTIITKHPQRLSPNSHRVPSPMEHSHLHLLNHHHPYHRGGDAPPSTNLLHSRLTVPLEARPNNNGPSNIRVPSPLVQMELRNLTEKPDPLSVVTSTSLSFPHHSMYRINGVRPEVISGGALTSNNSSSPTTNPNSNGNGRTNNSLGSPGHHPILMRKSPNSLISRSPNASPQSNASSSGSSSMHTHSPGSGSNSTIVAGGALGMSPPNNHGQSNGSNSHHHVNLNRTPTVIMGEAGGVRTMLWSQPGQNMPPEVGNSPNHNPLPSSTSNGHYGQGEMNGHHPPTHTMTNGHHNSPPPTMHLQSNNNNNNNNHQKGGGLSMEHLWASEALNLSTGQNTANGLNGGNIPLPVSHQNGHNGHGGHHISASNGSSHGHQDDDEYEQPMICMICEDRATGLHYGIITCEGCKGFFKRTVQNRRVYTCVADGTCEITKAQRNRCQYCRFKKCIEQGMVLQAVREDRMPGGRNSGAVYNLYKVPVKYRKHKKGNRANGAGGKNNNNNNNNEKMNANNQSPNHHITNGHHHMNGSQNGTGPPSNGNGPPSIPNSISGTILKAALTSPNEVNQMRQAAGIPFDQAASMITHLVQCDNFHDIAALQNWEELLEGRGDLSEKLCQMGDSIVYRLVQWTKRLPFYSEVPVEVHTRVLTHKWHELLVLTTSAWQAMHTPGPRDLSVEEETMENLQILQRCLQAMMGSSLTLDQLRRDVGQMVERLTYLTRSFRRLGIRLEEYVSLKVIAMLQNTGTKSPEVAMIQERYIKCLRTFLEVRCPQQPNRLNDLLRTLPEVQTAAALLLESKMFYVPFLLNSALLQR